MINRLSYFIAKHPKVILIAATLLLIPSVLGYLNTFVNYDLMSYLPEDIESVQGEEILDKSFNSAANAFLVVSNTESKEIVKMKNEIAEIDGVTSVTWIDDIVDTSIPESMLPDAITDIFYSQDKTSTLLMIQFKEGSATSSTMNAIKEIRTKMNKQCFLSGMSAIITDTKALSDSEAPKYILIAVVLALIALSFTMDSWVLPLVLLTALGYAIIYNLGTNIFMPNGISYITQSIAAILQLGVTMDYSVFLMDRFNEELKHTDDKTTAMAHAVSATFLSLAGSSLTTIFGFLALCFMSLTLGMDIGIVMAKGVLLGVLTVVIVLPAFLLLFYKPIYKLKHKRIIPSFSGLNKVIVKHRKAFVVIFALLILPSYIAKSAVPLDYVVSNALPEELDSVQALTKLKTDFNMATTHFVIIDDTVPSGEVSEMIDEFEDVDGVSEVISLNSFVGPAISEDILPDAIKDICIKDGKQLMMINSVYGASTDEQNAQIDVLTGILKKYDPNGYLTGEGAMSKDLISVTDQDFKVTSIISIAAIFILIAICFKSFAIPLILVASIELAIFINLAIALVTGADVSFVAPTIISCVQLGATVDYAILMTTRYREELRRGHDKLTAMKVAADASDKSIFQSALVFFCATFGVYCSCNIEIVKNICSMLARGAVVSGIIIIVFLPALLTCFEGFINKTTYHWMKPEKSKQDDDTTQTAEETQPQSTDVAENRQNKKKNSKEKGDKSKLKASQIIKKTVALGTALAMVLCMTACGKEASDTEETAKTQTTVKQPVYTAEPGSVSKSETVYINMSNSGSIDNISVTDWLHTDKGKVCVNDKSSLKDISNIKGDTLPVEVDGGLQWNMTDTDLYYGGTTDKNPPVDIGLEYYLDGKKVSADKIAGKSGEVKIEVNMKNNMSKTVKINGKNQKVYLPVLVVGGFILPEAEFSGVSVQNGRAIGDGTKEIAVVFGVPGMGDSLGLSDLGLTEISGLNLGSKATVTADAKDFELSNMYFAAIPISSLNLELSKSNSVDDLKSVLSILKEVQDTIGSMDTEGIVKMLTSDANSMSSLMSVLTDAVELYNSNKALIDLLSKYATPENSEQLKQLLTFLTDENTKKAIKILSDSSVAEFLTGLADLGDAVPLASSLLEDLQDPEVQKALENLPETLEKISDIQKAVSDNQDTIDYLMSLLNDDTMDAVSKLVSMLNESDIADMEKKYGALAENADVVAERLQKWIAYGSSYKIFTEAGDNMTTSVMFVYMTPSIQKEEETTKATTESSGESPLDEFIKKFK